jgi:carbon-monoxide dehydrogenase medium subunit
MTTIAELAKHRKVGNLLKALAQGASVLGTPQVRNRATLGGNFCNARPCADTAPPAMVLSANLELESADGNRRMVPSDEFFLGPGRTVIGPNEILVALHFSNPAKNSGSAYFKLGTRKSGEISQVSAAAFLVLEEGLIKDARIALGSVAPVPVLVPGAAEILVGKAPDEKEFRKAARRASLDIEPIDDFRAGAAYRKEMAEVLVYRALKAAIEDAGASD